MLRSVAVIILVIAFALTVNINAEKKVVQKRDRVPESSSEDKDPNIQPPQLPPTIIDENDKWCRFEEIDTYLKLEQTFTTKECKICQCTKLHAIQCQPLKCMPTYCIDGSKPMNVSGQCCSQCAYETNATSCEYKNITFPHGTYIKTTTESAYCWCQNGNIECRKAAGSIVSSFDFWGEGTAIYMAVIVVCVMLILGTLVCAGCIFYFYYYYSKRSQQSVGQVYEEYWNNAGWQPMPEGEQSLDLAAQQKQAEAGLNPYANNATEDFVPPPYAAYKNS